MFSTGILIKKNDHAFSKLSHLNCIVFKVSALINCV